MKWFRQNQMWCKYLIAWDKTVKTWIIKKIWCASLFNERSFFFLFVFICLTCAVCHNFHPASSTDPACGFLSNYAASQPTVPRSLGNRANILITQIMAKDNTWRQKVYINQVEMHTQRQRSTLTTVLSQNIYGIKKSQSGPKIRRFLNLHIYSIHLQKL